MGEIFFSRLPQFLKKKVLKVQKYDTVIFENGVIVTLWDFEK